MNYENSYLKLEPLPSTLDLDRGLRAEIHDPLWFLAKQWLMSEHQGEDAGVPVAVRFEALEAPLLTSNRSLPSPAEHPIEAIVEGSNADYWTPGRRLRLGAAYGKAAVLSAGARTRMLCDELPPPYQRFNGQAIDGMKAHEADPDHQAFEEVPRVRPDMYKPESFEHRVEGALSAGGANIRIRSNGRAIDWYSCEADGSPTWRRAKRQEARTEPIGFPGMPNARWWEIENVHVDPARYGFDRSHLGTGMLISLISGVSNDWYGFLWPASAGSLTSLANVRVIDSFEDEYDVHPAENWSLFHIDGIADPHLLFLVSAAAPMRGEVIEDVYLSVDEETGLVLAQERRLAGNDVPTTMADVEPGPPAHSPGASGATHSYRPISGVRQRLHPYLPDRPGSGGRLTQGRLADLSSDEPAWMPLAEAKLLGAGETVHEIDPGTVLQHGVAATRRWHLARDSEGRPVLWLRRSARPSVAAPLPPVRRDTVQRLPTGAQASD